MDDVLYVWVSGTDVAKLSMEQVIERALHQQEQRMESHWREIKKLDEMQNSGFQSLHKHVLTQQRRIDVQSDHIKEMCARMHSQVSGAMVCSRS